MMELLPKTNFDFIGKRYISYVLSAVLLAASFYIWFATGDDKYGIDYSGGHEVVVKVQQETTSEDVRSAMEAAGIEDPTVQSFEVGSNEYAVRFPSFDHEDPSQETKQARELVEQALEKAFGQNFEIRKQDYVGPTIGAELRTKALIAVLLGLIGILVYVSFRFEFAYALGAVMALFHDVIVTMGAYLFCDFSVSVATLAAALTIVGYSVNDTIVIFDRVREEILKRKTVDLAEVLNYAINATLSRTLIMSLLTFFSAFALFIFGGGPLADLSFFLLVGVVAGSYSTIFIASPIALAWENFRNSRSVTAA